MNDGPDDTRHPGRATLTDDELASLLAATGRRPDAPPERADRVRSVARFVWQAEVSRRRQLRRVWTVAALATAATVLVVAAWGLRWPALLQQPVESVARVEIASSTSLQMPGAAASAVIARPGDEVPTGSVLTTAGDGRLALRLSSGHSVRLQAGSQVRLVSRRSLLLEVGTVYVDSAAASGESAEPLEIRTPFATIREIGTQFEVRVDAATLRVRVREGAVSLRHRDQGVEVPAGRELEMDAAGATSGRALSPFDADWDWVNDLLPVMEIEGRTLRQFLDWAARERGLRLEFGDDATEAAASGITLNGSIAGMTLDQALTSVLLTSGMNHRIEADRLRIERPDENGGR